MTRPSVIEVMFAHARIAASRSTCPAKHVGAVIARGDVVLAMGYNGAPRGLSHCDDVGCVVIPGQGMRDSTRAVDHREYSRHVHAEANAVVHCARDGRSTEGCDLYLTTMPCPDCAKLIIQAGITRVIVPQSEEAGVRFNPEPRASILFTSFRFLLDAGVEVCFEDAGPDPDQELQLAREEGFAAGQAAPRGMGGYLG